MSRSARFADFLDRHRLALLMAWSAHAFLIHWFLLGFVSWDGLTYRTPPMIEMVQSGALGLAKYDQWAFDGYVPFAELLHVPFLWAFELRGLIVGYPLVVFPLCVASMYRFLRELSGDRRAATFGALAFVAIPTVNQQPYAGYVDFVVCALFAFFLFAALRLRRTGRGLALVAAATALFTLSRAQAFYMTAFLLPVLACFVVSRSARLRLVGGWALGAAPSVAIQIAKYLAHGTPAYPFRFELLGVAIGEGVTRKELFLYAGLPDTTLFYYAQKTLGAWIVPLAFPVKDLFDSRNFGGGFVMVVALALLPRFVRGKRLAVGLVATCVAMSLVARDFWLPRYAYAIVLAVVVVVGMGMSALAASGRRAWLFWAAAAVLLAHLARPEYDLALAEAGYGVGPRLDVASSASFVSGPGAIEPFPDRGARIVIVEQTQNGFVLPLYGERLTNRVVATVRKTDLRDACTTLAAIAETDPELLFVDDQDLTHDCARECAITTRAGPCRAYALRPAQATLR